MVQHAYHLCWSFALRMDSFGQRRFPCARLIREDIYLNELRAQFLHSNWTGIDTALSECNKSRNNLVGREAEGGEVVDGLETVSDKHVPAPRRWAPAMQARNLFVTRQLSSELIH